MPVFRKVSWHPVENYANSSLVQFVDEEHEILRCSKTAGGGKITRDLIAPGHIQWVFCNRQEFHVREACFFQISYQLVGQFSVSEPAIVLFGNQHP